MRRLRSSLTPLLLRYYAAYNVAAATIRFDTPAGYLAEDVPLEYGAAFWHGTDWRRPASVEDIGMPRDRQLLLTYVDEEGTPGEILGIILQHTRPSKKSKKEQSGTKARYWVGSYNDWASLNPESTANTHVQDVKMLSKDTISRFFFFRYTMMTQQSHNSN